MFERAQPPHMRIHLASVPPSKEKAGRLVPTKPLERTSSLSSLAHQHLAPTALFKLSQHLPFASLLRSVYQHPAHPTQQTLPVPAATFFMIPGQTSPMRTLSTALLHNRPWQTLPAHKPIARAQLPDTG